MISLPDIAIRTLLYESANSLVYQGIFNTNRQPVILKLLKENYPAPAELYRYQQEYEITRCLNLKETTKAYELRRYQNTLVMLLEDFGGESLKILLEGRPFSLLEFIQIAIQITNSLGKIHQKNVIHKDINPSNIILNPQTGQLKIIDFGLSTLLSQENPSITIPNVLEGTLAYMSPEQTGRMNRLLDYRSDFYSLGVTFYELLTNQLPFESADALELVHCHIAKQPTPPHKINPKIPLTLSEIVMKLMAKKAEDRYRSAWGIKVDLETCLIQYQNGAIPSFTLGHQDISYQLQIPQKLYGREREIESLLTAFLRVASGQEKKVGLGLANNFSELTTTQEQNSPLQVQTELMLISGYSGIGKSALVQELYKFITEKRGYFIKGKFDQLHRDIPYQALVSAFQELVQQLLTETESQLQQWREKIRRALGVNGQIIIDVIPELELILGKQPVVLELPPTEAKNRFNLVFQNFLHVFCQKDHPLVLFLDDLQWIDSATLQLLQLIVTNANTQYLFVIGAYRDNEVSATHPAMLTLSEIKKQGIVVNHLSLSLLNLNQVNELIADTLKAECIHTQRLAELVLEKTQGNPFFIKEFLKSLYTEELLKFDTNTGAWSWDLEQIITRDITENVVELMTEKIQRLSEAAQKILQLAACIGNQFDLQLLSIINEKSLKETANELWDAIQVGLVLPVGHDYKFIQTDLELNELKITYKFTHDRIQQAAYSLIRSDNKQAIHWKIGQLLLQNTPQQILQQKIFDIVNQLNFGIETISSGAALPLQNNLTSLTNAITIQLEQDKLAQLNLIAGKKAKESTAWVSAGNYLIIGRNCLSADSWSRQYDLTLELYVEAAEIARLNGNFQEMEKLANVVLQQATSLLDKVKIYEIKIQAYTIQNQPLEAIKTALSVLKLLDIHFPKKPNKLDILIELGRTKLILAGKQIEDLINLPVMTDPYKLAAIRILSSIASAAHFATPNLLPLIAFKQVYLSIKYGNTSVSACAYATYAVILSGETLGDIETGYRFGKLALLLVEKFNALELKAKTILIVNYFVKHWKEHLRTTLTPLQEAYLIGMETGDLEYAAYAACVYSYHSYVMGKELASVEREMAMYSNTLSHLKQETSFYYNQLNRQVVLNLMGQSEDKCRLIGESYDEVKMLPLHLKANAQNLCHSVYFHKLVLCYLFQDYQQALFNAQLAEKYDDSAIGTIPLYHFYNSLVHLAIYSEASKSEQKLILHKVKANQKKLNKWAQFAPMHHLHKFYIVEAERAKVLGENAKAIDCYDLAISLAKENEYLNEEALAHELAAKFYIAWGKEQVAQAYLTNAYYCYLRWGAIAKMKDLEQQYPQLVKRFTTGKTSKDSLNNQHSMSDSNSGEILDLVSLMKASQAIASEIELDKLLTTLMRILLENSGAQIGYLILESLGELRVEASGEANSNQVIVLQSAPVETCLPLSIINYVQRTQAGLIEADVAREGRFTQDAYIKTYQPKSILCAPLLNQGQLIGIVYLENNLAEGVFTSERLEVIQLLSTQAAISLTNARLYTQVSSTQNRLNKFLNAIPLGISVHDAKGKLVYANQVFQQLLNIQNLLESETEQISKKSRIYRADTGEMYPVEQLPLVRSLGGEKARADDLELHQNSRIVPIEATSTPIFDETGVVEYAIASFQDISERKQAQKTLIENARLEQEISDAVTAATQRQLVEAELERAKEAAVAANLAKSTFLANMSHELRTPLNAILGFSQLMNQDANLLTEQKENLGIIHRSGEHLLTLINQVLDLSKIEAGRMALSKTNFNIHHLLADVEDMFVLKAKDKDLQLRFECADDVPQYICTDEVKLRQVLINLISNAIKFTNSGSVSCEVRRDISAESFYKAKGNSEAETQATNGVAKLGHKISKGNLITKDSAVVAPNFDELDIEALPINQNHHSDPQCPTNNQQPKDDIDFSQNIAITFEVKDTGVGIAEDELENLFKPFLQTRSGQRLQQGTGLGLMISRQFVRLMGGEITVISGNKAFTPEMALRDFHDDTTLLPTSGTTFKFDISVGKSHEADIDTQPQNRRVVALAPNQPHYRILVVDDREYNRQLLVKLLKPLGFEVQEATNGTEAIEIWDSYSPHLIWMDMRMPVMDGYEATKRIKGTTKGQATAVIALTASVWEEEKAVILSAGCDDFVRKPFHKEVIFEIMTKHLGVHYIYQEQEPSRASHVIIEPLKLNDLLAEMPKKWVIKLHKAALDADSELVYKILEEIPETDALARQTFRGWVKKFQFEKILDLTEPLVNDNCRKG